MDPPQPVTPVVARPDFTRIEEDEYDLAIEAKLALIMARKNALTAQGHALAARADAKCGKKAVRIEPLVYLNVGGLSYHTTSANLTKIPGSRLEILFSGRHELAKDEKQDYFIDRDGPLFAHVLNFLRDELLEEPLDDTERKLLVQEFEYYGIPLPTASLSAVPPTISVAMVVAAPSNAPSPPVVNETIYTLLDKKENRLKEKAAKLKEEEDESGEEVRVVAEVNKLTSEKIILNVSGTTMATSRSTLCYTSDSMLSAMFTEGSRHTLVHDREGKVFLDRDAARFRLVLNALRNASQDLHVTVPPTAQAELEKLCIAIPPELLVSATHDFRVGPNYALSNGNRRATKCSPKDAWDVTVLSSRPLSRTSGTQVVHVRYLTPSAANGIMLGLAPATIDARRENNYSTGGHGWYLFLQHQAGFYNASSGNRGQVIAQRLNPSVAQDAWIQLDPVVRSISYSFTGPSNWQVGWSSIDTSQELLLSFLLSCGGSWIEIII